MLIKMDDLKKILKLVLLTGNLKGYKPVSMLIVSKSGNGKTELITSFKKKGVEFLTDMSYGGIIPWLEKDKTIKHIIVPDFIKITQKKRSTADNLISLLNALLEEGAGKFKVFGGEHDLEGRRIGMITATTKQSYAQHKSSWSSFGFVQRMLIVSYDYTDETINKIMDSINCEEFIKVYSEKMIGVSQEVKSEKNLNCQLNKLSNNNFRSLKQLQALVKANALERNSKKVEQKDIDEIKRLSKFMNLNYTKI